ncbi:MAG: phospholipase D-like domain-containing protein [Caldisericaceae bacterium]
MKKNNSFLFIIFVLTIIIAGLFVYSIFTSIAPQNSQPLQNNSSLSSAELFTEPDDSMQPIIDGIDTAKQSIDVEVYIFTDKDVFDALLNAKKRGVNVRVMLEENPYNSYGANKDMKDKLSHYGIDTKWSNRVYKYTHSKFIVIDNRTGYIMTLNLSKSALTKNREFGVITSDTQTVRELEKIFEADWARKPYNPQNSSLVVSPENSRDKISSLIESATSELLIYDEEIQCKSIEQLLEKKAIQGVKVYVVVADPSSVSSNNDIITEFRSHEINIRYVSSPFIHAKAIVQDRTNCYIGSVNLTDNSFDNNREVGIITNDPAIISSVSQTFMRDFDKGN